MKSYFKFLSRNKLYTVINLLGLTISLAFIILLGAYVSKQMNTDSFQENADRIYLFSSEESFDGAYYLHKHLQNRYPEIESSTIIACFQDVATMGDNTFNINAVYVDSTFFDIFTVKAVSDNVNDFSQGRNNVVISESFANNIFGNFNPIGQTISLEGSGSDFMIVGIVEDVTNSIIKNSDVYVRSEMLEDDDEMSGNGPSMGNWSFCASAFLCKENADIKAKEPDLLNWLKEECWLYQPENSSFYLHEAFFVPLRDAYFFHDYGDGGFPSQNLNSGEKKIVRILLYACLGLLFFAMMNYVNLTVAQTGFRAKEMATRRLLGTSKSRIFLKMIAESTVLSAIAFVIALFIADGLAPSASILLEYSFGIWEIMTPTFILLCVACIVLLGVLSGIIPALAISKFKPIDVMKGSFRTKTKMVYSKIFITLQNVVTITMTIAALTIYLQINHLLNMPLNYNTEDIFIVDGWDYFNDEKQISIFREELNKLSCVEAVGLGEGVPLDGGNNHTMKYDDGFVSFQKIIGDATYFKIFGFKIKKDNHLADPNAKGAYYLNEFAIKELKITEETSDFTVNPNTDYESVIKIAGIYNDFKIFNALTGNRSGLIRNIGEYDMINNIPWTIVIKIRGNKDDAVQEIEKAFKAAVPEAPNLFGGMYYEDLIKKDYVKERQLLKIVDIFTLVAILISSLGLLAISTYYVRQREKDIAIRKTFGATSLEVLKKSVSIFMLYVSMAFVISIPISYYILNRWLESYIYRIEMYWWIFAAAGLFAFVMTFVTVLWQSIHAAETNPVETLKKE